MPAILTYEELKVLNARILNESSTLIKASSLGFSRKDTPSNTVFLSYSSKDSELIPFIIKVLRNHGGSPYIDKGDERLPKPPSVETAKVLKDTIKICKRVVVFITTNSKDSKWVPWELGIGDGAKTNFDIAIFPTAENAYETSWIEQEYLGLYRRIVWGKMKGYEKDIWMVYDHKDNTATALDNWLK